MKALETAYAGCRFRSRLEARWAVFFDVMSIKWAYEPEGFELHIPRMVALGVPWDSGPDTFDFIPMRYLPDFWLPTLDAWYEVKGQQPTAIEQWLATDLAITSGKEVFIASGSIPERQQVSDDMGIASFRGGDGMYDDGYLWCVCNVCGQPGIQYTGFGDRICRHPENGRVWTFTDPRINKALKEARSARFGT